MTSPGRAGTTVTGPNVSVIGLVSQSFVLPGFRCPTTLPMDVIVRRATASGDPHAEPEGITDVLTLVTDEPDEPGGMVSRRRSPLWP